METTKAPKGVFPYNAGPVPSASEEAGVVNLRNGRRRKLAGPDVARVDRLPPHSLEAEQGVIGCMLLDPNQTVGLCVERLQGKEAFYDLRHQTLYEVIVEMADRREPVEVITLQQVLKDRGLLDQIGGIAYLNLVQDAVPSAANVTYYLDYVAEKHLLRKMVTTCTDVVNRVYEYTGDADALLDEVERDVLAIGRQHAATDQTPIKKLVHHAIGEIEKAFTSQGAITGLATGFPDLDRETDGLQPGDMIVLSGFPSTGKTSLAMTIVEHVAVDQRLPVTVFTHEMTPEALVRRILLSRARINMRNIREGNMSGADFPRLTHAAGAVESSPIHVVKSSGWTLGRIKAVARRMRQQYGIKLFVVDYLQKVRPDGRVDKRSDAVAQVSNGFKELAMELDVPGLILSQLNNEGGLFMSSETGMDADLIWKLRVDKACEEWRTPGAAVPVALDMEKQRNGDTPSIPLTFLRCYTRYESAARISDEDVQQ